MEGQTNRSSEFFRFGGVEQSQGFVEARIEFGERLLVVFHGCLIFAANAEEDAFGHVGGDLDLESERL